MLGEDKAQLSQAPFPIALGPVPQPRAGAGAGLVTHAFLLLVSRGDTEVVSTHRGTSGQVRVSPPPH